MVEKHADCTCVGNDIMKTYNSFKELYLTTSTKAFKDDPTQAKAKEKEIPKANGKSNPLTFGANSPEEQ
jgi:hypothetical protein